MCGTLWLLAVGCTHPLNGVFMAKLSNTIFEWDPVDYSRLVEAKMGEMKSLSECCTKGTEAN